MSRDDRSSNAEQSGDDSLDRLLGEARWPEPQPQRIERLWQVWRMRSQARGWRSWPRIAAAAAILVGAVTAGLVWRWHAQPVEVVRHSSQVLEESPEPLPMTEPLVAVRPANAYEQVVVFAAERWSKTESRSASPSEQRGPLHDAIERLTEDSEANLAELADELLASNEQSAARLEREFAERIRSETGARQVSAVRLLAHVGTTRSLPLLLGLSAWPPTHAAAVPGVARLADSVTVARMAMAERDPRLQMQLLAALLERGDRQGVLLFLNFVQDQRTTQIALDSLDGVAEPPVDPLFELLNSRNYPQRMAAARVLGRLDGPVISKRLAQMVVHDVNRREAILALLSCPDEDAIRFLQSAQQYPALAADIRRARNQLQTIQ
jgi:hypothetical protein